MSDKMIPLPIEHLYERMMTEFKRESSIWGIQEKSFFRTKNFKRLCGVRYGKLLESPLGVAAGPHTQLAQNIISAWLVGARYIELKTVQILDELEVAKPCIDMEDEGFNTEWSQELRIEESFDEYVKAFVLIHALQHKLKLKNEENQLGTIFNLSVGYDLKGVKSEKVQNFLKKMRYCPQELQESLRRLQKMDEELNKVKMPDGISDNITLSTMHGCPPHEVEQIARHLIEDLKFHTTVKLNPTLNGPHDVRKILNEQMGFEKVIVPDIAFEHDLKFEDAIKIIKELKLCAEKNKVEFSVKLTNTLETANVKGRLPKENEMMYMSGRSLHPLSINLAKKLIHEFSGDLDISFSAGVDATNAYQVLKTGMYPLTVCSDLLKPGGYERLPQYFENIMKEMVRLDANDLREYVLLCAKRDEYPLAKRKNIDEYHAQVMENAHYFKDSFPWENIKTSRPLQSFDCISAPCESTCPTNQRIPTYLYLTAQGEYDKALAVIRENNPLPHTTGMACDHTCEEKCTRMNYDDPLLIRDIKRFLAGVADKDEKVSPKRDLKKKIAIIGGGPSGLSAAYFLSLEGFKVDIYEAKSELGGMITYALPDFRTIQERVRKDIKRIIDLGVGVHLNHSIKSQEDFQKLASNYDGIYLAVGAKLPKKLGIPGEDLEGVQDFLTFLEDVKLKKRTALPKRVAVIGGGNSAIDAVRSAKRLLDKDGELYLIYRRSRKEMPANREELFELDEENIKVLELLSPLEAVGEKGVLKGLKVQKMKLQKVEGERARPVPVENSEEIIPLDFLIGAIGQEHDLSFLPSEIKNSLGENVFAVSSQKKIKVYAGGDLVRGPASIISGIADGKNAALSFLKDEDVIPDWVKPVDKGLSKKELRYKKVKRVSGEALIRATEEERKGFQVVIHDMTKELAQKEASRCLYCDEICDICVTVCPNRANVSYSMAPTKMSLKALEVKKGKVHLGEEVNFEINQRYQVLNIGEFCNECGNCSTFCPTSGRPFADKPKVYLTKKAYQEEQNESESFFYDKNEEKFYFKGEGDHFCLSSINREEKEVLMIETPYGELVLDRKSLQMNDFIPSNKEGKLNISLIFKALTLFDAYQKELV